MFCTKFVVLISISLHFNLMSMYNVFGKPVRPYDPVVGISSQSVGSEFIDNEPPATIVNDLAMPNNGLRLFPGNFHRAMDILATPSTDFTTSNDELMRPSGENKTAPYIAPAVHDVKMFAYPEETTAGNVTTLKPETDTPANKEGEGSGDGGTTTDGAGLPAANGPQSNDTNIPDHPDQALTTEAPEKTVTIPWGAVDEKHNMIYNEWGKTFGVIWKDTRFNLGTGFTLARIELESTPVFDYYPKGPKQTVCISGSTIYNAPPVSTWLKHAIYNRTHDRPMFMDLRKAIWKEGNSEECHTPKEIEWRHFTECQIRRHQRMEYLVPLYPLHQLGYQIVPGLTK